MTKPKLTELTLTLELNEPQMDFLRRAAEMYGSTENVVIRAVENARTRIESNEPRMAVLTRFLFELMRNHLPFGQIEFLLKLAKEDPSEEPDPIMLAYAKEVAARIGRR